MLTFIKNKLTKVNKIITYNMNYGFTYTVSKIFLLLGFISFIMSTKNMKSYLLKWKVLSLVGLDLDLCIYIDWISLMFFSTLCMMVSCVLKFSCVYMNNDNFKYRFTLMVLSFVFSMTCLIFIPHFFFLLIGWDGLGITSFLLVMYYLSDSSWGAGMKTYLINRMGDSFFMMGLMLFLSKGYWNMKSMDSKGVLCMIVVLGCFTKSAQFPFSSWLPAAMAAPTPVSSLVHSSTLVTAGIYVMMRFSHAFPIWLFILMGVSGMWTLYSASFAACCEYDCKKMVAYSTLSQLGLMTVSMSLNLPLIAFFHLITHAMFKALMFMCVGYLINNSGHFQDMRSLKGLWKSSPLLSMTLLMSKLSLLGFPFLAGFFSKELVVEKNMLMMNWVFHLLLLFSLPLTSYYSTRLSVNVLKNVNYKSVTSAKDKKVLYFSLLPLYLGSMFMGAYLYPWFYSMSSMYPCHAMKMMVLSLIFMGGFLSWKDVKINNKSLVWFCSKMSFLVPFKSSYWKKTLSNLGSSLYNSLDQGGLSQGIYSIDKWLTYSGNWLLGSLGYFTSPNATYYMGSMLSFLLFMSMLL